MATFEYLYFIGRNTEDRVEYWLSMNDNIDVNSLKRMFNSFVIHAQLPHDYLMVVFSDKIILGIKNEYVNAPNIDFIYDINIFNNPARTMYYAAIKSEEHNRMLYVNIGDVNLVAMINQVENHHVSMINYLANFLPNILIYSTRIH